MASLQQFFDPETHALAPFFKPPQHCAPTLPLASSMNEDHHSRQLQTFRHLLAAASSGAPVSPHEFETPEALLARLASSSTSLAVPSRKDKEAVFLWDGRGRSSEKAWEDLEVGESRPRTPRHCCQGLTRRALPPFAQSNWRSFDSERSLRVDSSSAGRWDGRRASARTRSTSRSASRSSHRPAGQR